MKNALRLTGLLVALWLTTDPTQAGQNPDAYCQQVCYPTCETFQTNCENAGGSITVLCSCTFWPYQYCSLGRCHVPDYD